MYRTHFPLLAKSFRQYGLTGTLHVHLILFQLAVWTGVGVPRLTVYVHSACHYEPGLIASFFIAQYRLVPHRRLYDMWRLGEMDIPFAYHTHSSVDLCRDCAGIISYP